MRSANFWAHPESEIKFEGVMKVLSEYLEMKRGTVALRSNNEVSVIAATVCSEEEIGKGRYRLGEGIIGRVAKLVRPL